MSGRSCGCMLPLGIPILRLWTVIGWPDCCEVSPGPLPAKYARQRSPAGSSLANMAANLLKSRIPPITAGWSLLCGPMLNIPKDVFSIRIHPLDTQDHMKTEKLWVDAGATSSPAETVPWM
jgi:hypothetical protein